MVRALKGRVVNYHYNNPAEADWISHTLSLLRPSLHLPLSLFRRIFALPFTRPPLPLKPSFSLSLSYTVVVTTAVYAVRDVYTRRRFYGNVNGWHSTLRTEERKAQPTGRPESRLSRCSSSHSEVYSATTVAVADYRFLTIILPSWKPSLPTYLPAACLLWSICRHSIILKRKDG